MQAIPMFSADLIKQLDEAYPARCPSLSDPERTIWFNAGARALVDNLKERLRTTNNLLPTQEE